MLKTVALCIFIGVYALLLLLPKYRAVVAVAAAVIFMVLGIVPVGEIVAVVDWNVLMMLAG
ncbi:MAG: arsenic transporter, partial [Ruminococcaceae bacterium]|nr:arsenic transporter [Oscillospiraceae bacterium]